jgi:hypothetical protein
MNKYSMTCSCGHEYSVDADSREAAVEMLKEKMTDEAIAEHMAEKHPGEPVPSKEQADAMVEQNTKEA